MTHNRSGGINPWILIAGALLGGGAGVFAGPVGVTVAAVADVEMREQSNSAHDTAAMNTRISSNGDRNEIIGLRFDLRDYTPAELANVRLRLTSYRADSFTRVVHLYGVSQGAVADEGIYTAEDWEESGLSTFGSLPGLMTSDGDYLTQSINPSQTAFLGELVVSGVAEGEEVVFEGLDLTTWVQSHSGGGSVAFLLAAGSSSGGQFRIASREATELTTPGLFTGSPGTFASRLDFTLPEVCSTCPLLISTQPTDLILFNGQTAIFSCQAVGTPPLSFQWYHDGNAVPGATNAFLELKNIQMSDAGEYVVLVSNASESTPSAAASLDVLALGSCYPAPAGLVAWWRGESNTWDSAGVNDRWQPDPRSGPSTLSYTNGKVGSVLQRFGGPPVYVPSEPELNVAAGPGLTLEFWLDSAIPAGFPVLRWYPPQFTGLAVTELVNG
ncbi:MAG: immunoglobulin domain-containing protein, partial [Verrucomicrobia bacterium]|nr:immunoglobulin domain-containing protein [Verrucomicrobiota bacterium]